MKQPAFNKIELEDAGLVYKQPEPPKNVFVFRSEILLKGDDIEVIRRNIKWQVEEGVVTLPPYLTLEAVTGPCTEVEVIIKQEEQP